MGKARQKREEDSRPKPGPARGGSDPAPVSSGAELDGGQAGAGTPGVHGGGGIFSACTKPWLLGLLLFLLVGGVFAPAVRHDFTYFDDPGFVTENPHVRAA